MTLSPGPLHRERPLAVALAPTSLADGQALLARARAEADLAELRLDLANEPYDPAALLEGRGGLPVIATLRPVDQGGRSTLPAAERFAVLLRAARAGAEYVDLEWTAATPDRIDALHQAGAYVLVSRHDFARVPPDFAPGWYDQLARLGADVVKLVGTATDPRDCLPVFRALRNADRPTVAIAMGAAGLPTRILAPREARCFLTFGTLVADPGTAPGQVPLVEMRTAYHATRLGGRTAAYGLLAGHVEREQAARYNRWFAAAGLDAVAVPFPATEDSDSAAIVAAFRELPISGWHIHGAQLQETVGQGLDALEPSACRQGKVNAIALQDNALVGAWVESPEAQFQLWTSRAAPTPA